MLHLEKFCIPVAALMFAAIVGFASTASAQTPGSTETSTDQTLAQDLASAPAPGKSAASITIGGQIQNGRTETKGLKIDGIVAHTTQKHALLRLDVEMDYARYRPAPDTPDLVVENSKLASLIYLHPLKSKFYLFGSTAWKRDEVLGLDYRAFAEAGAGRVLWANAKFNAFLGASYAVGKEHRAHTDTGDDVLDVGILQNVHIKISDVAGIEEWFKGHLQTTDSDDKSYQFNIAFLTKVTRHAGLKIYYKNQYDALVPPGTANRQTEVGAGLQIDFKPAAATAKP